jgi:hypothetical protein
VLKLQEFVAPRGPRNSRRAPDNHSWNRFQLSPKAANKAIELKLTKDEQHSDSRGELRTEAARECADSGVRDTWLCRKAATMTSSAYDPMPPEYTCMAVDTGSVE